MSDLPTSIQPQTIPLDGRIWDAERMTDMVMSAAAQGRRRAWMIKLGGLAMIGGTAWLAGGPIITGLAVIAWLLMGFGSVDGYYSGQLKGIMFQLQAIQESGVRVASIGQRCPPAAKLLEAARAQWMAAHGLDSKAQQQAAAKELASSFGKAIAAAHWILHDRPPTGDPITEDEWLAYMATVGLGQYEVDLMTRLSLAQLSDESRTSLGAPKRPFDLLAQAVESVLERVERF